MLLIIYFLGLCVDQGSTLLGFHKHISRRYSSFFSRLNTGVNVIDDDLPAVFDDEDNDVGKKKSTMMRSKKFHAFPFPYHTELNATIESLSNLGVGIARVPINDTKWVVMVPLTLPGEVVKLRIFRNNAGYSEADVVEILTPSLDRVEPQCKYFQLCGGCTYQHFDINAQRVWKRAQVTDLLQRIGEVDVPVNEVIGTSEHYGYRSKITPHYNPPHGPTKELKIGFQQRGTRIVIDIDQCLIATPQINKKYEETRAALTASLRTVTPKKGATLLFRECEEGIATDPREVITQKVGDYVFKHKAGEFFQVSPFVLPKLVDHVISKATGDGCVHLIDTYCGSGLFAISAAKHFQSIYGIEVSELAVKAAIANAELNQLSSSTIQFKCGLSEEIFKTVSTLPASETVIIIDPPRKGCDEQFLKQLFLFRPKKLVYVSCDPATQARDVKAIVAAGYVVVDVTPFDLFPQTRHIENVMTLVLA